MRACAERDIAELRKAEGKLYLFVAIDRTSRFAVAQLVEKADRKTAWEALEVLRDTFADAFVGAFFDAFFDAFVGATRHRRLA